MFKLIDSVFERIANHLAGNFCENLEAFEQNQRAMNRASDKAEESETAFIFEV